MSGPDLGDWEGAPPADWRRSMEAVAKATSYEHYLELVVEAAASELVDETEAHLRAR